MSLCQIKLCWLFGRIEWQSGIHPSPPEPSEHMPSQFWFSTEKITTLLSTFVARRPVRKDENFMKIQIKEDRMPSHPWSIPRPTLPKCLSKSLLISFNLGKRNIILLTDEKSYKLLKKWRTASPPPGNNNKNFLP